jgi:Holliday junction DNA helicase RuvB
MELEERCFKAFESLEPGFALMFTGFNGLGKTTMVRKISEKYKIPIYDEAIAWKNIENENYSVFAHKEWIMFEDEAQDLNKKYQTNLIYKIDNPIFQDTSGIGNRIEYLQTSFKYIFATTSPSYLLKAIQTRCYILQFDFWSDEDIIEMLEKDYPFKEDTFKIIAKMSKGIPREAVKIATCCFKNGSKINTALDILDIDKYGLNTFDRLYLEILNRRNRPVSLKDLASDIGLLDKDILEFIEPYLKRMNWIETSSGGRKITAGGKLVLGGNR